MMKNITSHGAILTKLRPTMARMTGATTRPISISSPTLRLMHPAHIDWIKSFRSARNYHGEEKFYYSSVLRQFDYWAVAKYQDSWICDKTWFRVISSRYPDVINSTGFSHAAFNRAISGHAAQCGSPNELGIHQFSMPCPYEGQRRKVFFYYWQVAEKPPAAPSGPHDCEEVHGRVRLIRQSMAEREESLPLSNLIQSTPCCNNRGTHDNKDDCDDNNGINIGSNDGRKDGMRTTFPIT